MQTQDLLMHTRRAVTAGAVALMGLVGAACGDDPVDVNFQVIEETDFAASLSIDLDAMVRTPTGVYWQDLVPGRPDGDPAVFGTTPLVSSTLWLSDGTRVRDSTFFFLMGNNRVPSGFEDGLLNTREGGTRRMVIPPNRGFGGQPRRDRTGNVTIPGGSVLVYEVTLDSILG